MAKTLSSFKVTELRAFVRKWTNSNRIKGYSTMKKAELLTAITRELDFGSGQTLRQIIQASMSAPIPAPRSAVPVPRPRPEPVPRPRPTPVPRPRPTPVPRPAESLKKPDPPKAAPRPAVEIPPGLKKSTYKSTPFKDKFWENFGKLVRTARNTSHIIIRSTRFYDFFSNLPVEYRDGLWSGTPQKQRLDLGARSLKIITSTSLDLYSVSAVLQDLMSEANRLSQDPGAPPTEIKLKYWELDPEKVNSDSFSVFSKGNFKLVNKINYNWVPDPLAGLNYRDDIP